MLRLANRAPRRGSVLRASSHIGFSGSALLRNSTGASVASSRHALLHRRTLSAFSKFPEQAGLYHPKEERDSCGVGMIAHLKRKPSRQIVEDADKMLFRMSHRGGTGCEPCSGDGAGMLVSIPQDFIRDVAKRDAGIILPAPQQYGVGNVFFAKNDSAIAEGKEIFESVAKRYGFKVLGWRKMPVNNSVLGETSGASEPAIQQVFVENTRKMDPYDFERELFLIRRVAQNECLESAVAKDFYVCSLSCRTLTYKGQLTPEQVSQYYLDLQDPNFACYVALVHSRFSTNTFPSWDRAQPNRIMCHNGEINTLRGNKNWMFSRGALVESEYFGDETQRFLPVCSDNMSDSGNFDSVLELIVKASDRTLPEAMMMMIPEAWQNHQFMSDELKAMYEYNSCLMEPWDGPAMMAFTDGNYIGATLDRNGLRPSRYYVTKDDHVILSSEIGVLPELPESNIKIKHRLEPGKMFLVDFEKGEIVSDTNVKKDLAAARPYVDWRKNLTRLSDWVAQSAAKKERKLNRYDSLARRDYLEQTNRRLNMFGYTTETMDMLLMPMGIEGKEALGSMGNDAALAVLSQQPKLPFDYFKQLFAQVTNPPIDPIREDLVMTLMCPVGPEGNILRPGPEHASRLIVNNPILSTEELAVVKSSEYRGWKSKTLDATFPAHSGPEELIEAIQNLCEEASSAIAGTPDEAGVPIIVISDKLAGPDRFPIPSLLAAGAVHQHLIRTQQRAKAAIFVEAGDAREVHDMCTLVGFGVDAICPYIAYEAFEKLNADGLFSARGANLTDAELHDNYRKALGKGMLKVMSKMGISTLQSYKGAQVFEAVGLAEDVMGLCFNGTTSRLQGASFATLYTDIARFHEAAYPAGRKEVPLVPNPGVFHYRNEGEEHFNSPAAMVALQQAARTNSRAAYKQYVDFSNKQAEKVSFRGLLKFKVDPTKSIPVEEVEPVKDIVKRFCTGAMSLGSISKETHETLAKAMNKLGGRSNTGEGGEDVERFYDDRRSAIKQVASGRFGVTSNYLANSDQIQIKMAQGAKPGEGGELPGDKVSPYIGSLRHTTPGVGLISPPPHHDIYSIEDLAQLIHDLKNANPKGSVSVKLVSEVGVGVVAAGVAKAKADHITISGGDGGTGAAAWTGIKGAGLPWELGIAEAQQTLVLNNLRSRVRLQADGQLKTGRDVVIAALLGAEEFGFSTGPLIALGCIMMRKCHLNTCPVGIATQDEELRKKFAGKPEHVINFFWMMAEEIREHMAALGFRNMDDLIGRADLLEVDQSKLHYKSRGLDLAPLLINASILNEVALPRKTMEQDHGIDQALDNAIVSDAQAALKNKEKVHLTYPVTNLNRTVGTMLSYEVSKAYGEEGLPDDTINIKLEGHGGQSLGFTLAKGITIEVEGDSNDYVGKGLSGGKIAVYPHRDLLNEGYVAEDHVIIGNVALYGGTQGEAYFRGKAGERFAVRNSGVKTVVEGVGDHGCEYMTGGRVVVLGGTGRNFAAGMSGGIAYIYDPNGDFPPRCNMGMVGLENIEKGSFEEEELKELLQKHVEQTGSAVGKVLLSDWAKELRHFVKVIPHEYKKVLIQQRGGGEPEAAVA